MGGVDKALLMLGGRTLIEHAIERARPQVDELLLNTNSEDGRFAAFGLPVLRDRVAGFLGPLAGILSGLAWIKANRPQAKWLATFACDTPFFPDDLVARLLKEAGRADALTSIAASNGRRHNIFAVWSTAICETAESALTDRGLRKMDDFIALFANVRVDVPADRVDPFFNVNTPEDLVRAEAVMADEDPIR